MLIMKESYYKNIEKELEEYLYQTFYIPLLAIIENPIYYNSTNDVIIALKKGTISFKDGEFKGKFNIKISKELSRFAKFDKRSKSWKVESMVKVPSDIKGAVSIVASENEQMQSEMNTLFDNLDDRFNQNIEPIIQTSIGKTIDEMQVQLEQDLSSIGIPLTLTDDQREALIKDYNNNQHLNIKNWDYEQVQRLRDTVTRTNEIGFSKSSLKEMIETEWGVTANKAKFLARQETSLFLSKFRREQNLRVGVRKYIWSTSQDEKVRPEDGTKMTPGNNHRMLNGKMFFYGDPPIVDTKTGRRAEPGEDFNCRCVAKSVL